MSTVESQPEGFLDIKAVIARTTLSKPTIYAYIHDPEQNFPRQFTIGRRRVVWSESEVNAWMSAKVAAARKAEIR